MEKIIEVIFNLVAINV